MAQHSMSILNFWRWRVETKTARIMKMVHFNAVHSNPRASPIARCTRFATSRLDSPPPSPPPSPSAAAEEDGTGSSSCRWYHGAGFMRKKKESIPLYPLTVVPWNMAPPARTATGVTSPAISANRGLNRSRYGSRHVVPSGQTARSPPASTDCMITLSLPRSRVSRTVGIGAIISDKPERLYVTAVTFRCTTVERTAGSSSVRWLHAYNVPPRHRGGAPPRCALIWKPVAAARRRPTL
uniref:Uncharacterized protein n=1 Tax=Oryza rufipogon TaxID=4529 RepID=A0A0E0QDZ1_ORYRU